MAEPETSSTNLERSSTNPERSLPFAILGVVCGFALIALPFLFETVSIGLQPFRWQLIIVGLACIAAGLGSQAVVKYKLFAAGGTAAIVVIFASLFAPKPTFVYGTIRGAGEFRSAVMEATSRFLVGRPTDDGPLHFFARDEELKGPIFSITAQNMEGATPRRIIIGCIRIDLLKQHLGNTDGLDLTMKKDDSDPANPRWKLVQTTKSESLGQWGNPECGADDKPSLKAASLPSKIRDMIVSPAYAQNYTPPPTTPLKLPEDVKAIFYELETGDFPSQIRTQDRTARLRDAASIKAIVLEWKTPWKSQVDTSLLVAWVRSIRLDRATAVPIASAMTREQLNHIVTLAGAGDETTRYNATELLSWMLQSTGWPSGTPAPQADVILDAALQPFTETQTFFQSGGADPSALVARGRSAFNAMVALNDARCVLKDPASSQAATALRTFTSSSLVQVFQLQKTSAAVGQFLNQQCSR